MIFHLLHESLFVGRGVLAGALLVTTSELVHPCPSISQALAYPNVRKKGGRGSVTTVREARPSVMSPLSCSAARKKITIFARSAPFHCRSTHTSGD
jgi:hypothetical protein